MERLPKPLVAADVDLRGAPLPMATLIELAMVEFGLSREVAERETRAAAASYGMPVDEVGHG